MRLIPVAKRRSRQATTRHQPIKTPQKPPDLRAPRTLGTHQLAPPKRSDQTRTLTLADTLTPEVYAHDVTTSRKHPVSNSIVLENT